MSFWIGAILMVIMTGVFLSMPLWRRDNRALTRADFDINVYKDQLKELERDLERGLITENEAHTARLEVQQRLLAADEQRRQIVDMSPKFSKSAPMSVLIIVVWVVGTSMALYTQLGSYGYRDVPFASRDLGSENRFASGGQDMSAEIAAIQKHLLENPDDVDAILDLGRAYRSDGQMRKAVEAMEKALELTDRHPYVLTEFAETKVVALHGAADDITERALLESLRKDPTQHKAMFFLGYVKAQFEEYANAMQIWTDLIAMSPEGAPWLPRVKDQMEITYNNSGVNPADFKPSEMAIQLAKRMAEANKQAAAGPGPSREDIEAASEMSPEEQIAMIRSMVQRLADRLEENPDDAAGWARLASVYEVLGETEKAANAKAQLERLQNQ